MAQIPLLTLMLEKCDIELDLIKLSQGGNAGSVRAGKRLEANEFGKLWVFLRVQTGGALA